MGDNTTGANVNEILTGYYLVGNWKKFMNSAHARGILADIVSEMLLEREYEDQKGRAQKMAAAVKRWAVMNGYRGEVETVWWTSKPGLLSMAYGSDAGKNPSDLLIRFSTGEFLGISAKSIQRPRKVTITNPGIESIESVLNIDIRGAYETQTAVVIKKFDLPIGQGARAKLARKDPKIRAIMNEEGDKVITLLRDLLASRLEQMSTKELKDYLLTYWIIADEIEPRFIIVKGLGQGSGGYSAKVIDPLRRQKLIAFSNNRLEIVPLAKNSMGITAVGASIEKILTIRFKYKDVKLGSTMKLIGEEW